MFDLRPCAWAINLQAGDLMNLEDQIDNCLKEIEDIDGQINKIYSEMLTKIARKHLNLKTLETRGSDSKDFHELAIWDIKTALSQAFKAGYAVGALAK